MFQDQNAGKLFADEAAAMYERAVTTHLKDNMLLYFAYADFEEVSKEKCLLFNVWTIKSGWGKHNNFLQ